MEPDQNGAVEHPPTTKDTEKNQPVDDLSSAGALGGRSRRRRNVVGRSPHRAEYVALMEAGWSSLALERYALHRFGEDVPASTFRTYRRRLKLDPVKARMAPADPEAVIDVLALRSELIQLQASRLMIDVEHERSMKKLFGSTKGEMELMSNLLSAHKGDLQDVGLFPKAGEEMTLNVPVPTSENSPRFRSLGDLMPDADGEARRELAKVLHLATREAASSE